MVDSSVAERDQMRQARSEVELRWRLGVIDHTGSNAGELLDKSGMSHRAGAAVSRR
jgi:hypothetical protein